MVKLLKGIAYVIIGISIIVGIIEASQTDKLMEEVLGSDYEAGFRWALAFTYWISGILTGIVFYALGVIVNHLEYLSSRMYNMEYEAKKNAAPVSSMGNSKSSMDKLRDFKI